MDHIWWTHCTWFSRILSSPSYRTFKDAVLQPAPAVVAAATATVQITVQSSPLSFYLPFHPVSLSPSLSLYYALTPPPYTRVQTVLLSAAWRDGRRRTRAHFRALRHTRSEKVLHRQRENSLNQRQFWGMSSSYGPWLLVCLTVQCVNAYYCDICFIMLKVTQIFLGIIIINNENRFSLDLVKTFEWLWGVLVQPSASVGPLPDVRERFPRQRREWSYAIELGEIWSDEEKSSFVRWVTKSAIVLRPQQPSRKYPLTGPGGVHFASCQVETVTTSPRDCTVRLSEFVRH